MMFQVSIIHNLKDVVQSAVSHRNLHKGRDRWIGAKRFMDIILYILSFEDETFERKNDPRSDTTCNYTTVICRGVQKSTHVARKKKTRVLLPLSFFFFFFIRLSQGLKDLWIDVSYFVVKRDLFEVDDRHTKPKSSFTDTVLFVPR